MLRRSDRILEKNTNHRKYIAELFAYNIQHLNSAINKDKLFYYENLCKLFLKYNNVFMYDIYNIRAEWFYDKTMRNFLSSAKENKDKLESTYITEYALNKKEETRILYYINRLITFIEKYLNKKTEPLKKTILNTDVINHINSFL